MTKCEELQIKKHRHNQRFPADQKVVPQCKTNGLFEEVQSNIATGNYWCVNKKTGKRIKGTRTYGEKPDCPSRLNS